MNLFMRPKHDNTRACLRPRPHRCPFPAKDFIRRWVTASPIALLSYHPARYRLAEVWTRFQLGSGIQARWDNARRGKPFMSRSISRLACAVVALAGAISLILPQAQAADQPGDPRMAEHALGNPKAPVRIDEYFSLDCSHCAAFDAETLPQLKKDYIDTGKVYLVLHDYPLHELAVRATMLTRCAPPERFIPMVDTLFHVQSGWLLQSMDASVAALKQQAKFAGMSDDQINACLSDHALENEILDARLDAENKLQIDATPTFIFNQKSDARIVSAAPYETFKETIDALLKK